MSDLLDASVEAVKVAGSPDGPVPVLVLGVEDRRDVLPVFIAFEEAESIARGLDAEDFGRPLTHDLTLDLVEELGGRVDHAVIRGVEEGTFVADLHVDTPRSSAVVDCRPSDAVALVSRTNAPIKVAREVFEDAREPLANYADFEDIREVAR